MMIYGASGCDLYEVTCPQSLKGKDGDKSEIGDVRSLSVFKGMVIIFICHFVQI